MWILRLLCIIWLTLWDSQTFVESQSHGKLFPKPEDCESVWSGTSECILPSSLLILLLLVQSYTLRGVTTAIQLLQELFKIKSICSTSSSLIRKPACYLSRWYLYYMRVFFFFIFTCIYFLSWKIFIIFTTVPFVPF